MSTSSEPQLTPEQIKKLQAKFARFRILVIGRANAGKTTILQRLCNTTGEPMIFSPNGRKIKSSVLNPSMGRGEHDIKNQMIFKSNPGFIFHDAPGFEAGSAQELKMVQEFIKERSRARSVKEQLHAIWYCIPTSDDRPITAAEKKFFIECGTGLVPVIVLWTKTDSLDVAKIKQLMKEEGNSRAEAMQQAPQRAWTDFEQSIHQQFEEFKYPPKAYVVFRKMHEPGADCKDLIEKTAAALSSEELQQLFLSTQQNNMEVCIKYGVKRLLNQAGSTIFKGNWVYIMVFALTYFPQIYIYDGGSSWGSWGGDDSSWSSSLLDDYRLWKLSKDSKLEDESLLSLLFNRNLEIYQIHSFSKIMSPILSNLSTEFNLKEATYCAIVAAIIGHLSFFLSQKSPSTKDSLQRAVQIYQQSTCDASVKQAIERIFELENISKGPQATSHVKHTFPNPFKRFLHVDDVNCELLVEEAIQTALNNLLSEK